uniref:Sucrose phosphatase-like domain-containing protein n=1 Tax=Tetraselmis chuii TaxID=63592 RepID=A0A7S1SZK8_9CHLO|mmetsp:Transcript_37871/g.67885  ORF Transcript_37871/g.67885 Transcript_37871/m.67885 type:complete len:278 (+) Transcript_37871:132-965(+)|eukprot:CAMPEP_0177775012 /NCGR_PEP_ID=MMETSP0491_2-20121128/13847_1 /TAXON_ID=63592 /ORGANISM="Tetraselmis chuii, Strain PLY429" /LENGTH=277 /DNA_ID=CAMNT_0019293497 /DNA_START=99 /DNA_END=932 /DNA_ORIENTATION=+
MAEAVLLVTDLDNTLLGDNAASVRFAELWRASAAGSKLVYATGRDFDSYVWLVESGVLPAPDVSITSTGADIRHASDPTLGEQWATFVAEVWKPEAALQAVSGFGFPVLECTPLRLVLGLPEGASSDALHARVDDMSAALHRACDHSPELVISTHHDGTFLDILPPGVDKGSAVAFVQKYFGFGDDATVVAGDSENDWAMLRLPGRRGVVVGNANPDLLKLCNTLGPDNKLYYAKAFYAEGVIEGLRHHRVIPANNAPITAESTESAAAPKPVLVPS